MMDINIIKGLSTIFVAIAFFGVCWWAYSPKRKKKFDEAANLPFADDKQFDEATRSNEKSE